MKKKFLVSFKQVLEDRQLAVALGFFLITTIIYMIYVSAMISPSELQVVVRYTSFGITNFYRDQWYYLINFVLFGLVVSIVNTVVAVKLYRTKGSQFAVSFAWLSVLIIIIAWVAARSILRLAALS